VNEKALQTLEYDKIIRRLTAHCATSLGREHAQRLRPSRDLREAERLLKETDEAVRAVSLKGAAPFGGIADVRPHLARARLGGVLQPAELLDIAQVIAGIRKLKRYVASAQEEAELPLLGDLCEPLTDQKELEREIRRCIDEQGSVVDDASPELSQIRREIRVPETRFRETLRTMIRSPSARKMI